MSDNKQPDALDRLRRRPSPSATPVAKDAPLLNDEARKLLEDKSKAAAQATKRAAKAGAKKSLDAGKAALGKFNSWRHERAEAKVKVDMPVEKLAPLEGLTGDDVAEALSDIAVPELEADPDSGKHLIGYDLTMHAVMSDSIAFGRDEKSAPLEGLTGDDVSEALSDIVVPEQDADHEIENDKSGFIELGTAKGSFTSDADAYAPDKGLPAGLSPKDMDMREHIHAFGETSSGMTHGGSTHSLDAEQGHEPKQANVKRAPTDKPTKAPSLKRYWIAAAVLAVVVVGLLAYKLIDRGAPVESVEPESAPTSQPAPPSSVSEPAPVQVTTAPEPAPVMVEPLPEVIEPAPVVPTLAPEPEVQAVVPVNPAVVEKPVVVPAPKPAPAPKPVAAAKPPAVEKPKAAKPAAAPAVSPESKKQIDSIRDFEKQLENLGG